MPCQTLEYKQTVLEETTGNAKAKSLQAEPAIWCFSCKGSRIFGTAKVFPDLGGCWGCFRNNAARLFFTCRKDRVGLDYVRLNQVYICSPNYWLTHSHQSLNYVSMDTCQATSITCYLFDSNTLPIIFVYLPIDMGLSENRTHQNLVADNRLMTSAILLQTHHISTGDWPSAGVEVDHARELRMLGWDCQIL